MKRSLTFLLVAGILGCGDIIGPKDGPVSVSVSVAKSEILRGTPAAVIVVVRNGSAISRRVAPFCISDFSVRDTRGMNIPLGFVCNAAMTTTVLAPGDSLVLRDAWDGAAATVDGGKAFVPPGDYVLTGRVRAADDDGAQQEALSRPLWVRLK